MPRTTQNPLAVVLSLTAGALALLVATSCATTRVDPAFYRARSIAVVGFHGNEAIAGTSGLLAALQSTTNAWGEDIVEPLYDAASQRIAQAMGATLAPVDVVVAAPSYASLAAWGDDRASPRGLRPLSTEAVHDAEKGALARELDVDAVIVVRFEWSVAGDSVGNQRGVAAMELVVVGREGERLWSETAVGEAKPPATWTQAGAQMIGAMNADTAKEMVRGASDAAVERFFESVVKNRPNALLAP